MYRRGWPRRRRKPSGNRTRVQYELYPERLPTQHEHAREIRKLLKIRDFDDGDLQLREHIAGRVWASNDGPRALFDRAVTWLLRNRVLLPGLTSLGYLVAEVRKGEQGVDLLGGGRPGGAGIPARAAGDPRRPREGLPLGAGTVAQGAADGRARGRRRRWSVPGTFAG